MQSSRLRSYGGHIERASSATQRPRHDSIRSFWGIVATTARSGSQVVLGPSKSLDHSSPFRPSRSLSRRRACLAGPGIRPRARRRLHAGIVDANGRLVVAAGANGLYEFARGAWTRCFCRSSARRGSIRGIFRLFDGKVLLFGEAGFAMTLSRSGAAERVPLRDRDLRFVGASADENGLLLVGQRASREVGVLVELPRVGPPSVIVAEGIACLHGVVRLSTGIVIAVGTQGALLEVRNGDAKQVPWARTGHLYAVASAPATWFWPWEVAAMLLRL